MRKDCEYKRDDVIRAVAAHLGYSQVSPAIRNRMRSTFNSAIRRGLLGYRGQWIWKEG